MLLRRRWRRRNEISRSSIGACAECALCHRVRANEALRGSEAAIGVPQLRLRASRGCSTVAAQLTAARESVISGQHAASIGESGRWGGPWCGQAVGWLELDSWRRICTKIRAWWRRDPVLLGCRRVQLLLGCGLELLQLAGARCGQPVRWLELCS